MSGFGEQTSNIPPEPPLRPWSSWKSRPKRSKAIFLSVAILLSGVVAYLLLGRGNDTSSNGTAALMAVTRDGDELDYVQFGVGSSVAKLLEESFRLRIDEVPSSIEVLDEGGPSSVPFLTVPNGRIALIAESDDQQGLIVIKPGSGLEVELIEYDDVLLSATYVRRSSQFFVTVAEEDRSRCVGVDLKGNQVLVGRGYCQVLDSGDVLAIDTDDDTNEVSVVKADDKGQQTGRYDFELDDFVVTTDGSFAYGFEQDGAERSLLAVYDFREERVWRQPADAISAALVSEMSRGLAIAVDRGTEEVSVELVMSTDEGSEVSTIASAEEVSVFVVDSAEKLIVGESMAGKDIDQWRMYGQLGTPVDGFIFEDAITAWFEIPALDRIVAFDGAKGEIFTGSIESGLEYVDDVNAEYISVYSTGQNVFVHADESLFLLDVEMKDLFRLSNDMAQVDYFSSELGVFIYQDEDENSFLARYVDGALVDVDEDDNIYPEVVEAGGFLYYSTSDDDGDNLTLKSIKLQNDGVQQGSEVDRDIAEDVLLLRAESRSGSDVEVSYPRLFEAVVDQRRRECRDEGLEILDVSEETTLPSIPGIGSVVCLTVAEADLDIDSFFGVEISNDGDFDLAMTVQQDDVTLYEADDQLSGGRIISYSPLRDDMTLDVGTYRLRVYPVEGGGVSAPTAIRFFATSTSTAEFSEMERELSFSTSVCDYVLDSSEPSVTIGISNDTTSVLCIERRSTDTIVGFTVITVRDGMFLDVGYECDDFSGNFYSSSYFELMPSGKGYNVCYISETYPFDGEFGDVRVFYDGD